VWVAAKFTDEHHATLDWLNNITDTASVRFFGVEVELWRIGASEPAPRFNIVSKPNDWSQSVKQAARAIGDDELTDISTHLVNSSVQCICQAFSGSGIGFSASNLYSTSKGDRAANLREVAF